MNTKARKFLNYMKTNDIDIFDFAEKGDSVIFFSEMSICGQEMTTTLVLNDEDEFNELRVKLNINIGARKILKLEEFMNVANARYNTGKYFISDGEIFYSICLIADKNRFDYEMMLYICQLALKEIEERYFTFIKIIRT